MQRSDLNVRTLLYSCMYLTTYLSVKPFIPGVKMFIKLIQATGMYVGLTETRKNLRKLCSG